VLLVIRPTRPIWTAALALNVAAMAAFLLSRTTGLPSSTDDIGNWAQTLGVINLVVEAALIGFAATVIRPRRRR
jgi:steroid 5-alpha reductase family enzyme